MNNENTSAGEYKIRNSVNKNGNILRIHTAFEVAQ